MTALHWFHSHSHSHHRLHDYTLRYLLPIVLAMLLFFLLASPARGQVMVDESQLHGKLPSWVDPAYAKPTAAESPIIVERIYPPVTERVWIPAVTRTIAERVWVEDRYEYRTITRCVDGRLICERVLVLVQPAHFETRWREIVIFPGHWETVTRY
jgi:hypothetical protein